MADAAGTGMWKMCADLAETQTRVPQPAPAASTRNSLQGQPVAPPRLSPSWL